MASLAHSLKLFVTASFLLTTLLAATIHSGPQTEGKVLRHVVLFRYKDTASQDDKKKVEDAFRVLPSKINEIRGFE